MTQRPLKVLRLVSLLLCCVALWALTLRHRHQLVFTAGGRLWWLQCQDGRISTVTVAAWPRPERSRWMHDDQPLLSTDRMPVIRGTATGWLREWKRLGLAGQYGLIETLLDERGNPVSLMDMSLWESHRGPPLHQSGPMAYQSVGVPLWMPAALFGVYPLASFSRGGARRGARRRRAAQGQCVDCGYNLTGNTSGVCPECGRAG